MPDISKITLPSGNTYDIKDATARQIISGGIQTVILYSGGVPNVERIPHNVEIVYEGTTYTGEWAASAAGQQYANAIFFILSSTQTDDIEDVIDYYDEYIVVKPTPDYATWHWEKIGDTQINLTDVVTGVSLTKQTDVVLGEATTFTNGSSSVSFSGGATDKVLGEATTFTSSTPTITVTPSTTNVKATASGGSTAWNSKDQKTVVTGYTIAAANKDTFVKSVTAETGKNLVTTTVPNVTGNTSVTIPNVTGNTTVNIPNVTSAGTASTWSFAMGSGDAAETLIISGANSTAPTLGTQLQATKTTLGTSLTATNTTLGTAKTVATGATSTTGTGDAVVTGVTVGDSADAIISLPSPSTASVIGASSTFTNTQPTVKLETGATAGTGVVSVATGITSATSTKPTVTANKDDVVTAVTQVGTGTAAAQTITVGTNDKVTVLKSTTDVSVTKGNA